LRVELVDDMLRYVGFVGAAEEVEGETQQAAPVYPSFAAIQRLFRIPSLEGAQGVVVAPQSEAVRADVGGGVVEEAEAG
jgi:hypothetical protein